MTTKELEDLQIDITNELHNNPSAYRVPTWVSLAIKEVFDRHYSALEYHEWIPNPNAKDRITACRKCEICNNDNLPVPPLGKLNAHDIMIIGEAPGEEEVKKATPFVGPAGQLLHKIIDKIGWAEDSIFITNTIMCRPPENRNPTQCEIANCYIHNRDLINIVKPKLIICAGAIASSTFIHPGFKITNEHGKFFELSDYEWNPTAMAIFHPAYLLRLTGEDRINANNLVWDAIQAADNFLKGNENNV